MDIRNKVALVTGGSRGLGRSMAIHLARNGAKVIVNFRTEVDNANEVVQEINRLGQEAIAIQADVGKRKDVFEMADQIYEKFGRVDILVNNAGAIIRPAEWDKITEEGMDQTIDTNLKGTIYCLQAFTPRMIENKQGGIINITSTYAIVGAAPVLAYTAAKAGIISITKSMAKELGQHGITVNAIAPGNFDTDMSKGAGEDVMEWVVSTTPMGRFGKPGEVADAAVFLLNSEFITGHVLVVDGGQLLNI